MLYMTNFSPTGATLHSTAYAHCRAASIETLDGSVPGTLTA